jgi:hypothetical protein
MQYRSRSDQMLPKSSLHTFVFRQTSGPTDSLFDTSPLPRPMRAVNWIQETHIHRAVCLTTKLANSNQFVGTQKMIARDEVRRCTHLIAIERDGLFYYLLRSPTDVAKEQLSDGNIRRAHICLRKFDGKPIVSWVAESNRKGKLLVEGKDITTSALDVDFPYMAVGQPPIGFPATNPPNDGILLYKCRESGKSFARRFNPMSLAFEQDKELPFGTTLGGADADLNETKVLVRAQVIQVNTVQTHVCESTDFGRNFTPAKQLDLSAVPHDREIPSNAPVTIDYTRNFHIPVAVGNGSETMLLDALQDDDLVVAAISGGESVNNAVVDFPAMPTIQAAFREGFGDGSLDGNGIIATMNVAGRLLVANSQSGGYSYPEASHLNYDMQSVYMFRSTQCYTRGVDPNTVSMDYAFIEADADGRPLSAELWVDTWDMPLPTPLISQVRIGDQVRVTIRRSGWFFPGQTAFELDPANTFIKNVKFNGFREAVLEFHDPSKLDGATLSFQTKNVFFFHKASIAL